MTVAYLANEFKFFYGTRSFIAGFRLLFHKRLSAALLKTATAVYTSGAAIRCYPFSLYDSACVRDVEKEVLGLALLRNRIYKKKKKRVFNKCLAHCLPGTGFFLFTAVRKRPGFPNANRCSVSVISNSVSNKSKADCFNIFKDSKLNNRTQFRAARDKAARGNGTALHHASRVAARHKTAAAGRAAM
jgi:hypothetical protein